jgi:hypothetical protein
VLRPRVPLPGGAQHRLLDAGPRSLPAKRGPARRLLQTSVPRAAWSTPDKSSDVTNTTQLSDAGDIGEVEALCAELVAELREMRDTVSLYQTTLPRLSLHRSWAG